MRKKSGKSTLQENSGKLILDLGKLTFGSFILGGILRGGTPQYIIILIGTAFSGLCMFLGLLMVSGKKE